MIRRACTATLLRSLVATNEVLDTAMQAPFLRLCTPQLFVLQEGFEGKGQGQALFILRFVLMLSNYAHYFCKPIAGSGFCISL